jgi:hypothetical protein
LEPASLLEKPRITAQGPILYKLSVGLVSFF